MIRLLLIAAIAAAQTTAVPAFDVSSVTVSPPALVCELDMNQLKGEMRRLSWFPTAATFTSRPPTAPTSTTTSSP
jgi:hypothetical protein